MIYIKTYRQLTENISIFSQDIKKLLPNKLNLITSTGQWVLEKSDLMINGDLIQIAYYQNTPSKSGDPLSDGEPDYLEFDIHILKKNDGTKANPDTLRLNIDITYGDAMVCEFTIDKPNKVNVHHYTSIKSKYDPETLFSFSDDSITDLINFFNSFGYTLDNKDLSFLDSDPNSYQPNY